MVMHARQSARRKAISTLREQFKIGPMTEADFEFREVTRVATDDRQVIAVELWKRVATERVVITPTVQVSEDDDDSIDSLLI